MATASQPRKPVEGSRHEAVIEQQLAQAIKRVRMLDVGVSVLGLLVGVLTFGLIMIVLDRALVLSDSVRQWAFFGFLGVAAIYVYWMLIRPLGRRINPYFAAKNVEKTLPTAKNSIVNYLDLRGENLPSSVKTAIGGRAAQDLRKVDIHEAIKGRQLVFMGALAGTLFAAVVILLLVLKPAQFFSLLNRAFSPFAPTEIATRTQLYLVSPEEGDTTVTIGEPVHFVVQVDGAIPEQESPTALRLRYRYSQDIPEYEEMRFNPGKDNREWVLRMAPRQVQTGFWYYIAGGDARTPEYRVDVKSLPLFTGFEVAYNYPKYLRWEPQTTNKIGCQDPLEAIQGTEVTLTAHTNRNVTKAWLQIDGVPQPVPGELIAGEPKSARFHLTLTESATYRVWFTSDQGEQNRDPKPYSIKVFTDHAPKWSWIKPEEEEITLPANGLLPLEALATDDFGIDTATLRMQIAGDIPTRLEAKPYREGKSFRRESDNSYPTRLEYKDFVELSKLNTEAGAPANLKEGMILEYWLQATDNRKVDRKSLTLEANIGKSTIRRVRLGPPQTEEQQQKEQQKQRDELQQEQKQHEKQQDQQHQNEPRDPQQPQEQNADQPNEEQPQNQEGDRKPDEGQDKGDQAQPNQGDKDKPDKGQPQEGDQTNEGDPNNQQANNTRENAGPDDLDKKLDQFNEEANKFEKEKGSAKRDSQAKSDQERAQPGQEKGDGNPEKGDAPQQQAKAEPKDAGKTESGDPMNTGQEQQQQQPNTSEPKDAGSLEKKCEKCSGKGGGQNPKPGSQGEGNSEAKSPPLGGIDSAQNKPKPEKGSGENSGGGQSSDPMSPDNGSTNQQAQQNPGAPKGNGLPETNPARDRQPSDPQNAASPGQPKGDRDPQRAHAKDAGDTGPNQNAQPQAAQSKPEQSPDRAEAKPMPREGDPKDNQTGQPKEGIAKADPNAPQQGQEGEPKPAPSQPMGGDQVAKGDPKPEEAGQPKGQPSNQSDTSELQQNLQNLTAGDPKTREKAKQSLEDYRKEHGDEKTAQDIARAMKEMQKQGDKPQEGTDPKKGEDVARTGEKPKDQGDMGMGGTEPKKGDDVARGDNPKENPEDQDNMGTQGTEPKKGDDVARGDPMGDKPMGQDPMSGDPMGGDPMGDPMGQGDQKGDPEAERKLQELVQKEFEQMMEDLNSDDPQKRAEAEKKLEQLQELAKKAQEEAKQKGDQPMGGDPMNTDIAQNQDDPQEPRDPREPDQQANRGDPRGNPQGTNRDQPPSSTPDIPDPIPADPRHRLKAMEMQLEKLKEYKHNKQLRERLGWSDEEYAKIAQEHQKQIEALRDQIAEQNNLDPGSRTGNSFLNQGASRTQATNPDEQGDLQRLGPTAPPREFRNPFKNFQDRYRNVKPRRSE